MSEVVDQARGGVALYRGKCKTGSAGELEQGEPQGLVGVPTSQRGVSRAYQLTLRATRDFAP